MKVSRFFTTEANKFYVQYGKRDGKGLFLLSFFYTWKIQEIVNILWPIARWCDDSVQGVWQQCKTEILIYGQQKKETQRTCTTKNYVNDHLYKKNRANTSSIWSKSRNWQKSIAHIFSRPRWCTFFKPAYFLGQRPRKFKVNSDFVTQHLRNFVSNLCTCWCSFYTSK